MGCGTCDGNNPGAFRALEEVKCFFSWQFGDQVKDVAQSARPNTAGGM